MRERPLAALDFEFLGRGNFQQMADGRGQDVIVALEIIAMPRKAAQSPRNVGGDRGFFRDDERFCHSRLLILQQ